ncbi:MAG: alpha/beta hydrolase [Muribaculaceae bacterium]|nr:alpha/beta hydrolase [Muribaculaceae bacterium]
MKTKTRKRIWAGVVTLVVVLAVALLGGAWYLTDVALDTSGREKYTTEGRYDTEKEAYPYIVSWLDSVTATGALRDTFITLSNGEKAHGVYVLNPRANGRSAVVVHGHKVDHRSMINVAYLYNELMGMNVVLPDLHGHGLSDGNDARMGWKDRLDVLEWADRMQPVFVPDSVESQTILHGQSMGGATVMSASGEDLPPYIKAIVEDCGYTSVNDEFTNELNKKYHLPAFPLLNLASMVTKMRYGWSFGEANPEAQVARSKVPMLFIHGDNDSYVPTWMGPKNYEAKTEGYKELWLAPGSEHADAYKDHPEEFSQHVIDFLGKVLK